MKISDAFKKAQKTAFQDKTIYHRPKTTATGSLGSKTDGPGTITASYEVNFQIISDSLMAQEWGLSVAQDAVVTSSDVLSFSIGDYVQFGSKVYKIVGMPLHDSHAKLILKLTGEGAVASE